MNKFQSKLEALNIYKHLIEQNYNIEVASITSLVNHIETKVFIVKTQEEKYVFKEMNSDFLSHPENEGELLEYLYNHGIHVPKMIKTKNNDYFFCHGEKKYHLQQYMEGEVTPLNAATDVYLMESAQLLGQIQNVLKRYKQLPTLFDENYIKNAAIQTQKTINTLIRNADSENRTSLVKDLRERLKHIAKIATFEFDLDRLTYTNSHGDFYVNQIINDKRQLTVIDWTGACYLPACFEVIMSYSYADPFCKNGTINMKRFQRYLGHYLKFYPLNNYDFKIMPYFYYYQLCTCNFTPPYNDLSKDYLKIAIHCDNIMNWLFENVDILSNDLSTLYL